MSNIFQQSITTLVILFTEAYVIFSSPTQFASTWLLVHGNFFLSERRQYHFELEIGWIIIVPIQMKQNENKNKFLTL